MNDYILSCCSTVDLSAEHLASMNIPCANFHFFLDDKEYIDDLGQTLSYDDFYKAMQSGADTRTAQVNIAEYIEFFTPFLQKGKDILHITLSSGLSGSYNSAVNAALVLKEQYPERTIHIVDSLGASSGSGLFVHTLAELRDSGMSLAELRDFAETNRLRLHHWFFSTDLTFYIKGGRVSKAAGTIATVLGICPLLHMDVEGHLVPVEKVRSKKKVIKTIVDRMAECAEGGLDYSGRCFISQSACYEDARAVADLIEERFPKLKAPVEINHIGTTIGSHTGPGTVALFFWGDSRDPEVSEYARKLKD